MLAAVGAMGRASIVANWADLDTTFGAVANANQTLNFPGAARSIRVTYSEAITTFQYRLNSGAYTSCPSGTSFAVSSGNTLNFRADGAPFSGSVVTVRDNTLGYDIDYFICTGPL